MELSKPICHSSRSVIVTTSIFCLHLKPLWKQLLQCCNYSYLRSFTQSIKRKICWLFVCLADAKRQAFAVSKFDFAYTCILNNWTGLFASSCVPKSGSGKTKYASIQDERNIHHSPWHNDGWNMANCRRQSDGSGMKNCCLLTCKRGKMWEREKERRGKRDER